MTACFLGAFLAPIALVVLVLLAVWFLSRLLTSYDSGVRDGEDDEDDDVQSDIGLVKRVREGA